MVDQPIQSGVKRQRVDRTHRLFDDPAAHPCLCYQENQGEPEPAVVPKLMGYMVLNGRTLANCFFYRMDHRHTGVGILP